MSTEAERGWHWRALVAAAGLTRHAKPWALPLDVLHASVSCYDCVAVYLNRNADHAINDRGDRRWLAGYLHGAKPHAEGVECVLTLFPWQTELRDHLLGVVDYYQRQQRAPFFALALSSLLPEDGHTYVPMLTMPPFVANITDVTAVDFVIQPASNARILALVSPDAEPKETRMSDPTPQDAVDAASALVKQLHDDELHLDAQHEQLSASLDGVRAGAGAAVLAALHGHQDGARNAVNRVAQVQAELDAIADAIGLVRTRRRAAIEAYNVAALASQRGKAAAKRAELAAHECEVNALLAQLQRLAGSPFIPSRALEAYAHGGGALVEWSPELRSEIMQREIAELESEAQQQFGPRLVAKSRSHWAPTITGLIVQTTNNAYELGPTRASIRAWAQQADPAGVAERYTLAWQDGEILPAASSVAMPPPAQVARLLAQRAA